MVVVKTATVQVNDNRIYPVINIVTPQTVTCRNAMVTIDASASSNGSNYTYEWKAINGGTIVSGANTLNPIISSNGVFELIIKKYNEFVYKFTDRSCYSR